MRNRPPSCSFNTHRRENRGNDNVIDDEEDEEDADDDDDDDDDDEVVADEEDVDAAGSLGSVLTSQSWHSRFVDNDVSSGKFT